MKKCSTCKIPQDTSNFTKKTGTKDGLCHTCKDCKKKENSKYRNTEDAKKEKAENNRQRKLKVRKQYYDYMQDKSCMTCGESHIACLQFDHRDPKDKSFNISQGITDRYSWNKMLTEIDKCDILCANCHAKRTAIQFNWYNFA